VRENHLILSLCVLTGCSPTLTCGANDTDNFNAKIYNDISYTWVAVNHSVVKLVIKWNQILNGSDCG